MAAVKRCGKGSGASRACVADPVANRHPVDPVLAAPVEALSVEGCRLSTEAEISAMSSNAAATTQRSIRNARVPQALERDLGLARPRWLARRTHLHHPVPG
jgi:hypothetical protein